jgi:hypothetical protein
MSVDHQATRPGSQPIGCAYNLFRNKDARELFCAVPEHRCVPPFLTAEDWAFECKLTAGGLRQPGFHEEAARVGVRFNGFYIFQAIAAARPSKPVRRARGKAQGSLIPIQRVPLLDGSSPGRSDSQELQ